MREGSGPQKQLWGPGRVTGNHLIPVEFEAVGSVLVDRLLDSGGCFLEEALRLGQLGGGAGQDLPDRWEAHVCDHQLLLQLTDTPQHWEHNQKREVSLYSIIHGEK